MWLERFIIVVPTLGNPRLASTAGIYSPTWVEWAITSATFAGMLMLYLVFSKLFPIIAVWEFQLNAEEERDDLPDW
jgi:molybdopterin-containing oxidoreductase family membrane subunit